MEIGEWDLNWSNIKKTVNNPSRTIDELVLYYSLRSPMTVTNSQHTLGTNIFDKEWDVAIILDTCRVDALESVADEYDFIQDVESIWSVGGNSPEWIARTFDKNHLNLIENTIYLSANAHAQTILENRNPYKKDKHLNYKLLRHFDTVSKTDLQDIQYLFKYEPMGSSGEYGHERGGTPPRYVTDRAIDVGRNEDFDRLILHYFQPHSPWVSNAISQERKLKSHEEGFGYITETGDVDSAWDSYLDDLRWVLDDVEILLENMDQEKIVITADHGDAFNEYGVMSHKIGAIHPKIRKVPWVLTSGTDTETYEPTIERPTDSAVETEEINDQLEALGYKT
jgi:hypothetical protein